VLIRVTYHRRAVAQPCVNGDRLSKGRMAKFNPAQIRNPWTDRHKIWNRWLRPRDDPRAKFRANPSIRGFSANGWNI